METALSAKSLTGYSIQATDGSIGKVVELYFDDTTWVIRYVVVDVAHWLFHKKVLVSPEALGKPVVKGRYIPASITRDQVRRSPRVQTDMPVALQDQALLHAHYGWEYYWAAEALMANPDLFIPPPKNEEGKPFDPHLRATRVVVGHRVWTENGPVGRVEDFSIEFEKWTVRHLVMRSDEGNLICLLPSEVTHISVEDTLVFVKGVEAVK
jgi:sporulation protein YlmC with PRC-barrel domain